MGANAYSRAQAATKHTRLPTRYVLGALAQTAWDEDFVGVLDYAKFGKLIGMKERALRRAIHDIECSTEVTFAVRPDGAIVYRMLWAMFDYMNSLNEAPPIPMEWPLEYRQQGAKCPRPPRAVWTKTDEAERKEFRLLHRELREQEAADRREIKKVRQG